MKKYLLLFLIFFILIGTRIFTIHNAFDSLPSARAFVSSWLGQDWYLSQPVPYRFLFNIPAGWLYEFTNFWATFFTLKVFQFGLFAYIFSKLLPRFGMSLVGIVIFIFVFSSNQSMVAGEWIYGDPDPKSFAYLCFFFGLNSYFDKKFLRSSFLLGVACSFHVLVGGYLSLLYFGMKLIQTKKMTLKETGVYLLGAALGVYAVVNELTIGSNLSLDLIYIFMRVPHHVVPEWKLHGWIFEYIIYNLIFIFCYRRTKSQLVKSLILFPLLGNIFWIAGLVFHHSDHPEFLKYYLFRVTDTLFPFTAFLLISLSLDRYLNYTKKISVALTSLFLVICCYQFTVRLSKFSLSDKKYGDVYSWIKKNTPKDANFLINPAFSNFYVDAERGVLATYKNFPQLKNYFLESIERLEFASQVKLDRGLALNRDLLKKGYENRDPVLNFSNYKKYDIGYVMSDKLISSEHFLLVYQGKNAYVYQVLP